MSDLKPCPACGHKARLHRRSGVRGITRSRWYREWVSCSKKACGVRTGEYQRPGRALLVWGNLPRNERHLFNWRPIDDDAKKGREILVWEKDYDGSYLAVFENGEWWCADTFPGNPQNLLENDEAWIPACGDKDDIWEAVRSIACK